MKILKNLLVLSSFFAIMLSANLYGEPQNATTKDPVAVFLKAHGGAKNSTARIYYSKEGDFIGTELIAADKNTLILDPKGNPMTQEEVNKFNKMKEELNDRRSQELLNEQSNTLNQ